MNQSSEREAVVQRITDYLSCGGLFNPELANHDAVRDLLIDCRAALSTQPQQATADLRNWGALVFPAMDQAAKALETIECESSYEQLLMDELVEKLKSLSIQYATIVRPLPPVPGQEGGTDG